jgi:mannose-6-phosphate isomerase-like protein (cupin superfamily)/ribosomal protein S18 acetylase RimI-like enzyme
MNTDKTVPDQTHKKDSAETAIHYKWGMNCDGWRLLQSPGLEVTRESMPPGTTEVLHCHRLTQQLFFVLAGVASFEVNGKTHTIHPDSYLHITPGTLHRIYNSQQQDLRFLVISQPAVGNDRLEIIPYQPELAKELKKLNVEWLEKYFKVEPNDELQLSDPQGEIIDKGGMIFFARKGSDIIGTASLLKIDNHFYELGKMAVTAAAQGFGTGHVLMEHCIHIAKQHGIKKLVLYSNRSLGPAIHLYKKYGFAEVPMEPGHYERANIKMEKTI